MTNTPTTRRRWATLTPAERKQRIWLDSLPMPIYEEGGPRHE